MEIFDWVKDLSVWVMHWANTPYGGLALFVLAFCESSFFPIPPDVLLIGLCMANSPMSFWYALICSLGSTLGGMLGYGIGRIGGRPLLERWVRAERIQLVERHYQRWDVWAVAVAGFTPIPYKVFTIAAGALHMLLPAFVLASIIGRGGRFFLVAGLIMWGGESMERRLRMHVDTIGWIVVVVGLAGFAYLQIR